MPGLGEVAVCSEAIDATLHRFLGLQRAIEDRRARGVAWFNDDAEHARLTAHIARLGDWLAQVRAAHAAIVHGASLQQAREVAG